MTAALVTTTPGVYFEEVLRSPEPELGTGVPAFLALVHAEDPQEQAHLFGSKTVVEVDFSTWSQLEARAATRWAGGYLGFAVRGFFENGGRRCFVVAPLPGGFTAGLDALELVPDFDLVCAPDLVAASVTPADVETAAGRQKELLQRCSERGGCFAILDSMGSPTPSGDVAIAAVKTHHAKLGGSVAADKGALYAPWIKVRSACPDCGGTGVKAQAACTACAGSGAGFVPPCGHVAGVYARTDRRVGVHKAPANEVLEGVVDLQLRLGAAEQAGMDRAINCLRAFPGRGVRVWGARTLSSDPDWNHVNVRRLVSTIGRFLERAGEGLVLEPNDLQLWVRISREVGVFLDGLFRQGALQGSTPEEAFFVKCDAETNPRGVRDTGQVVTEVGVAPARPNEFIVVRMVSGAEGATVSGGA